MANIYTAGLKQQKRRRWDIALLAVFVVLALLGFLIFRLFISKEEIAVDNTNNQPQTKVQGATTSKQTNIEENLFKLTLPGDWEEWEEEGGHTIDKVYQYQALGLRDNGRALKVYIDTMPNHRELYMTHLLPISSIDGGKRLVHDDISDLCRKFAPIEETKLTGVVKARWKDIEFDCDVHRYRNIVGTASKEEGYRVTLGNDEERAQHTFFFLYIDHGQRPTNYHFQDIISSFEAK